KTMTLSAMEFIRRFLLHVLPTHFMRIRHYGFMANRFRTEKLRRCRSLLLKHEKPEATVASMAVCPPNESAGEPTPAARCPHCQTGRMHIVEIFEPRCLPL